MEPVEHAVTDATEPVEQDVADVDDIDHISPVIDGEDKVTPGADPLWFAKLAEARADVMTLLLRLDCLTPFESRRMCFYGRAEFYLI